MEPLPPPGRRPSDGWVYKDRLPADEGTRLDGDAQNAVAGDEVGVFTEIAVVPVLDLDETIPARRHLRSPLFVAISRASGIERQTPAVRITVPYWGGKGFFPNDWGHSRRNPGIECKSTRFFRSMPVYPWVTNGESARGLSELKAW
jgi:hypothetical protein